MKYISIALALTLLMFCPDVIAKSDVKVLKLAHGLNTEHPVHKGMMYLSERADKLSDGSLRVEVFANEQLGNEKECIEALQLGYLAMTKVSSAGMESFVDDFKIFGIPYLFRDSEHFWKVTNSPIGKQLLESGTSKRLKGLCYYDAGARSFYAKKPINSPADLTADGKTLKIRVMNSPMAIQMISTMGGSPTPMSWGELYTSLDQGVVDAAENNPPSFHTSRHYEICKFYSLDEHVMVPDLLVISTRVWASLSDEHQQVLAKAVEESVIEQRKLWIEAEKKALEEVQAAGVTIVRPDKKPFVEAVKPMWEKNDKQFGKLIKQIQAVK